MGRQWNGFPRSGRIVVTKDNTIHGPFYYKIWMDKSLYYTLNGWGGMLQYTQELLSLNFMEPVMKTNTDWRAL